jgi:hypothetical protein
MIELIEERVSAAIDEVCGRYAPYRDDNGHLDSDKVDELIVDLRTQINRLRSDALVTELRSKVSEVSAAAVDHHPHFRPPSVASLPQPEPLSGVGS